METDGTRQRGGLFLEQTYPPPPRRWLLTGGRMAIGRAPSSQICVPDPRISWHHARLEHDGRAWSIVDEGSTNGTFVNGARIREAPIRPRDRIRLGDLELVLKQESPRPPAQQDDPSPAGPLRWWNRVTKTMLTAGAIASAVAAVFGLFPSHPTQNTGRFTAVQLISQTPLSELQQRSAGFTAHLSPGRRADGGFLAATRQATPPSPAGDVILAAAGPSASPAGAAIPATAGPSEPPATGPAGGSSTPQQTQSSAGGGAPGSAPPAGTGSPATGSPATGSPAATGSPSGTPTVSPSAPRFGHIRVSPASGPQGAADYRSESKVVQILHFSSCPPGSLCGEFIVSASATGPEAPAVSGTAKPAVTNVTGELASPAAAARRITGILGQTRTGPEGASRTKEPLGELVSVDMELAGLRGQPVFLAWSIFQAGGQTSLYGRWLREFIACRLVATTDDDTGSVEIWIPLPDVPGPFFARLTLSTDGASLASEDSGTFG